ncbi:AMP-binding protein [Anaeromyxobacter paludicola]|uniref:AMP-dependent acyl-CoA synthetase n=1 Tax=Anaeromyxobacter paludicola TaxID=2918171 RepID=A0ABN6N3H8_9BACT|nr:AMP-binding protein [Anaeromyxobacter paludicola]BDG07090.1 AMP-dependent acyl-CoA synthetase [Anaeromyxobacter paludicola]
MFLAPARHADSALALLDPVARIALTHGELRERADEGARALALVPRGLAVLLCRNDVPTVVAWLALVEAGWPVLLLDADADPAVTAPLLARYVPEVVIGPAESLPAAAPWRRIAFPGAPAVRRDGPPGPPPHPELTLLLSTSGSTGSPKLARLTRAAVEANARSITEALGIADHERAAGSLPLHYSYGLSVLNSHLVAGACVVLSRDSVVTERFWATLREGECTSFAGVPYTYQMLDRLALDALLPRTLLTMTQAGGKLAEPFLRRAAERMEARGGRFFVMYGATEATARMACLPAEALWRKIGSAGRAIPGGRLTVEVEDVRSEEADRTGEVVYEGPNVMMGYATTRDDLCRGDELGGVLRTGDLGRLDSDGFLWIAGRSKRIAKLFGLRVNLDEVENVLRGYAPAGVIAGEDRLLGFVQAGEELDLAGLSVELARRLRVYPRAVLLRRVGALPLLANGKLDYRALEALR